MEKVDCELHDDRWFGNTFSDAFVRQHLTTVNKHLVFHNDIFTEDSYTFETNPSTDDAPPADDARAEPRM